MWPLFLLGVGGAAYLYEKSASKQASASPWQPRSVAGSNDPAPAMNQPVIISLYNTGTGEARNVPGMVVSMQDAQGKYTILLGAGTSPVAPYGYEPGKMVMLARDQFLLA